MRLLFQILFGLGQVVFNGMRTTIDADNETGFQSTPVSNRDNSREIGC